MTVKVEVMTGVELKVEVGVAVELNVAVDVWVGGMAVLVFVGVLVWV